MTIDHSFSFDYTLWTTKNVQGKTLTKYKSILKLIDRNNYQLFRDMKRLRGSVNTLHGSLVYEGRWKEWYEWTAISILLKLTQVDKSLVVQIQDDFGCPLALELYREFKLDRDLDRRVYLHKGQIHSIPLKIPNLYSLKLLYSKAYERYFSPRDAAAYYIREINRNEPFPPDQYSKVISKSETTDIRNQTIMDKLTNIMSEIPEDEDAESPIHPPLIRTKLPKETTMMHSGAQVVIFGILRRLRFSKRWNNYLKIRRMRSLRPLLRDRVLLYNPNYLRLNLSDPEIREKLAKLRPNEYTNSFRG